MGLATEIIPSVRQVIYTTYAAFPTTGLAIEDLAWATDRYCLYRWSGSAWQTVGISSRHGNYADIGDPANYPESSIYQADDQNLLYMIVSAAWQQVTFMGLPNFVVGDVVVQTSPTMRQRSATSYAKIKEFVIASGGTIRVNFQMRLNGSGTAYGRVYKNDAAFGTERTTTSGTFQLYSEDLAFAASDKVQLWAKTQTSGQNTEVQNFQLLANKGHMHIVTLD